MRLWSDSFADGAWLPADLAFCVTDSVSHVTFSGNKNPHLAWAELPIGAKSLVLTCHDPDVPSRGDDVNHVGRTIPADLPRVDFFHWTLIDLPPDAPPIAAGELSAGVSARGKTGPDIAGMRSGARQAINDFTGWFAGDSAMAGDYFGYDGPCPPWNDALVHRYIFTLYALDIARLPVDAAFTGQQVKAALEAHVLAQAALTGLYTLNPDLR
jgi:Raf kinase inhibitor-like YbhB/YbcL family protein